jgi:hypothetical protein
MLYSLIYIILYMMLYTHLYTMVYSTVHTMLCTMVYVANTISVFSVGCLNNRYILEIKY